MGIFDIFKKDSNSVHHSQSEAAGKIPMQRGTAVSKRVSLNPRSVELLKNCYIAFDVETTGLSPFSDRIVEVGAVIFKNGIVQKSFSSLINPGVSISRPASAANHITDAILNKAPSEREVYPQLLSFLGDALHGEIIMCAHNARFDFEFLCNTLSRLGYDADIKYVDTLGLSKKYLCKLEDHKQSTVENYFGLTNSSAHRAASDAENCGHILWHLLDCVNESFEKTKLQMEQSKPNAQELEVCAFIQSVITQKGGDTRLLRFMKNGSGYVDMNCLFTFLKFKFVKKGSYILIRSDCPVVKKYVTESCTQSEGGTDYIRVYFSSPFDLEPLSDYIYEAFTNSYRAAERYATNNDYSLQEVEDEVIFTPSLTNDEVSSLLNNAREHNYAPVEISKASERQISRDDVTINATHDRVPLSKIRNAKNSDKGFDMGYPFWDKGDTERKNGNFALAVELFDEARLNGYYAPALYNSYAMLYRELKDYSNEIVILDEAISRLPEYASGWKARRDKAIHLLFAQQEKERIASEKAMQHAEKIAKKEAAASTPKQLRGRAILQMDDDGKIIKKFDSITAASQEVGVSPKCIRDAAKGIQKRAGGYCWKYSEEE